VDAPATTVLAQPLPPLPDAQDAFAAAQPPKYLN
jgi:hypothetical protein